MYTQILLLDYGSRALDLGHSLLFLIIHVKATLILKRSTTIIQPLSLVLVSDQAGS